MLGNGSDELIPLIARLRRAWVFARRTASGIEIHQAP
jgi:hypothetical protein